MLTTLDERGEKGGMSDRPVDLYAEKLLHKVLLSGFPLGK